jgi:DNA-binding response OmpR family regulator
LSIGLGGLGLHLLVVEDERRLAHVLQRVLQEHGYVVDLAYDGEDGCNSAVSGLYDAIILDLMLPGMDGLSICRHLRATKIATPVLMLTARSAVEERIEGLSVGADDYLIKPFAMGELLARIEAVLRRRDRQFNPPSTELRVGDLILDLTRHEARRAERIIELTAKEFALLELLMRHPQQVLSRAQIRDQVWRYDFDALSNVVDNYIYYLREKVDRGFGYPLIKTVRGVGYKIEP